METGAKLGRYELLTRIATGGMGEIFLARREGAAGFEKLCVIKRILPHLAGDARYRSMLIAEARIAANMSHANICHVYELEETDRQLYLVMEYLEGVTLLQLLRSALREREHLDFGLIAGVVQQACDGLHYAHELRDRNGGPLGVVHRDVTPSNVFLTESGVVKIVDFGIAKVNTAAATEAGVIKGKYAYMAPEQIERSGPIDRRVDVFSLAVVAAELITRHRLYQRETDYLTFRALMEPPTLELARHRPDAPPALTAVLERGLAHDIGKRYATARQFCAAMLDALGVKPWGQAEISELVRTRFADDIQRHNAEISKIIRRLDQAAREHEDDGYASIETEVVTTGVGQAVAELDQRPDLRSDAFGQALHASQSSPAVSALAAAPAQRSRVVSIVAILGAAATALTIGVALDREPAPHAPTTSVADATRPAVPRPVPSEPYGAAIQGRARELDQCARDQSESLPSTTTAVVLVGLDGRAKRIELHPDAANASALGNCIRGVLHGVVFPAANEDKELALGLALRR